MLRLAALASDAATQDPLDLAILEAARARGVLEGAARRIKFLPFDPSTKRSEGIYEQAGAILRVIKGAPLAVSTLVHNASTDHSAMLEQLAATGARVLAVASGHESNLQLAGFVALSDQVREDSKALIDSLRKLGIRVIMVTGDGAGTARAVAAQVGIGERVCSAQLLGENPPTAAGDCDVFAGVFPEDKFRLVDMLQRQGHVTGMTGDGVNDAPALKQAEVGIAVSTATDVAKAAASLVLTESGLSGIVTAVDTGRRIYQRMLTYTLNKIMKTFQIAIFLSAGLMLTGTFVVTPLLVVLLLFTNDFVTMSIATDRVVVSTQPDRWDIRKLMETAGVLAGLILILSFAVFYVGRDFLHLPLGPLQTLIFLLLVFTGQGNVYLVRERGRFWNSRPSRWLLLSSAADIAVVSWMAARGILMSPISWTYIGGLLLAVAVFLVVIDSAKIRVFRQFGIL